MSDGIEKRAVVSHQTQFHVRRVADSQPAMRNNQFSNYVQRIPSVGMSWLDVFIRKCAGWGVSQHF